jgi:Transposase DDE domain
MFVFGYKVHIPIDSLSGLPMMLTVTKAGYGDGRTVPWFVRMITKRLHLQVKKFMADAGYDGYRVRLLVVGKLKAMPFITLNPRNCKGGNHEEKMARCKKLRHRWYAKNFLKRWRVDPDSEEFDKEFDSRTFSEQGFSVGKGSLNLDALKGNGKDRATPSRRAGLHGHARRGKDCDRNRKVRPDEVGKMLPGEVSYSQPSILPVRLWPRRAPQVRG